MYNIIFGINGGNVVKGFNGSLGTSMFWGLLKILNLGLIVLLINCVIQFFLLS